MPHTDTLTDVTQALVDLLKLKWKTIGLSLKADIYYGDESRYPRYPAISVEPTTLDSVPTSTQLRMTNEFTIYIFLYEGSLKNLQVKRKDRDLRAEAIRDQIHTDRTLGGIIAHGNIVTIEPGVAILGQDQLLSSRLTWQGISKTEL